MKNQNFRMTASQLKKAATNTRYLILRHHLSQSIAGFNSRMVLKAIEKEKAHGNKKSIVGGFYECDLMEYISLKTPFIPN